jgi:2,4-dienoyl-CoA reductase-like NADH-dependent reductase (Old Yellow Enzyme family)/thioredoxin reductase
MRSDPILQPLWVGTLSLPNRVVMTTVKLGYAGKDGGVTDRHVAFYRRRAEGGVGLLTTEPLYVRPDGRELPTQMGLHEDSLVEGQRWLVDEVHRAGGRIMAHLNHAGRAANPKLVGEVDLLSASEVRCPANGAKPRSMDSADIQEVIKAFGEAARRARESGFDAVEIPFSHGYLIHQFLSPHSNRRDDGYGGSFENRLRFGLEVLDEVRERTAGTVPVVVRMNAMDYVEGGLGLDDAMRLGEALAAWGVDALSVTSGTMCESVPFCLYPAGTPQAHLLPMAAEIRRASGVPVIVAGRIRAPAVARRALEAGQTDLIGLGRPLLADPDWLQKVEAGDEEGILLCPACHQGCLGQLRKGAGTCCLVNPLTGRETELVLEPAAKPRQVVVVGGGPAGLEAAFVAASRGHRVSVFEARESVGGQLALAAKVPHKEGFQDVIRQLELMAERAGASIKKGVRLTPDDVLALEPDALILATGGVPMTTAFPGLDEVRWVQASDVLDGYAFPAGEPTDDAVFGDGPADPSRTDAVLVVGGGLVGLEVADFFSARGKPVVLVEMQKEVGEKLDILPRTMLLKRLKEQEVHILTSTIVTRFTAGGAEARQGEEEIRIPADLVVLAVGVEPNRELEDALQGAGLELYTVGDAREPRGAGEAILEGWEAGARI